MPTKQLACQLLIGDANKQIQPFNLRLRSVCRKTSNKRFNYTNSAQFVDFVPYRKNRKIEKKKRKKRGRQKWKRSPPRSNSPPPLPRRVETLRTVSIGKGGVGNVHALWFTAGMWVIEGCRCQACVTVGYSYRGDTEVQTRPSLERAVDN